MKKNFWKSQFKDFLLKKNNKTQYEEKINIISYLKKLKIEAQAIGRNQEISV